MKKLMIALAAAATTMFSFGDLPTGTSFEALATGAKTVADIVDYDDAGTTDGTLYWFSTAAKTDDLGVVTNEAPYTGTMRPQAYKDASNANYLTIDTSTPLYRTINGTASSIGDFEGTEIGDGLYLDTLVKFTAADSTNDLQLAEGDKIAISYVVEDMDDDGDGVYLTNFVVRAGYVNGSVIDQKNYVMDAIDDFDSTVWHRLTVRAISNVGSSSAAPVGFVVYVDGVALTYSTDVAAGDSDYVGSLNAAVVQNLYNSEKHALLPSAIDANATTYNTLSAVAFKGSGSIDDISFTQTLPEFIDEGMAVTIAWDAGVETVKIGADEAFATAGLDYTATNITVASGVTSLAVVATYAEGKESGEWDVPTGTTFANDTWSGFASGATLTIKSMTPLFKVGDTNYGDFTSALAAAVAAGTSSESPATIQLLGNVSEGIAFETGYIILDLNGKTIQGGETSRYVISNTGANLTIIDSATGGMVAAADRGSVLIRGDEAFTTIEAGKFAGVIAVTQLDQMLDTDVLVIKGGSFYDADYDPEDPEAAFYLAGNVDQTLYSISGPDAEGYFTVSSGVTPEPTTYKLTIPEVTGATATVTDADEQEISDLTAIAEGTVVTVTWAPSTGYKITAGASEEITMDANKTANEPTVVDITYATLTITQVENCTIVVSNTTEEVASGTQFDVDDATQLTVYRTPANGYKLSEGCAATETITMNANVTVTAVVEKEPEYPSYIDDEDTEAQGKYATWKSYVEGASETVGDGETLEDAYLLNCKPSEVEAAKAAFKFTSIGYDSTQSKWVTPTTTSYNNRDYNGEVVVKQYSDVGCTKESSTGTFFKAVLQ